MAIKFTQKLVLFSNTINHYTEKYHKLIASLTSKDRGEILQKRFIDIQSISDDIRALQVNFIEQFEKKGNKLPKKWHFFGLTLGAYIEVIVAHTYVVDELKESLEVTSFWKRIVSVRKTIKILGQLDELTKECVEKGDALNELINSGKYNA